MTQADEIQWLNGQVAVWQAYEPAVKCELWSTAVRLGSGWVFIDPIGLAIPAMREMLELAPPHAIVLTNGNHARAAAHWRQKLSIPIVAHADAASEVELDLGLADFLKVSPEIEIEQIEGACAGEIAIKFNPAQLLVVGDALIHLPPLGFTFLPDKYAADPAAMRQALRKLLRFEFELMTFAHGLPMVSTPRLHLQTLLS